MPRSKRIPKTVEALWHKDASRKNIPTAEYQAVMADDGCRGVDSLVPNR